MPDEKHTQDAKVHLTNTDDRNIAETDRNVTDSSLILVSSSGIQGIQGSIWNIRISNEIEKKPSIF